MDHHEGDEEKLIFKLKFLSSYSMSNVTLVEFNIKIKVLVEWELIGIKVSSL